MNLKKLPDYLKHPEKFVVFINRYKVGSLLPDRFLLKCIYKMFHGKKLNLKNPRTFNEKLQWLKLYDRKDEYTVMVDKYLSKEFVAQRIGEEYVVPVVGGPWKSFEEIDFDALPNQFVLKTNHDCGGVVVCKDKATFDKEAAKQFLNWHLKRDYYQTSREWPYKNVPRCIFAEKFMKNGEDSFLPVYKFLCFQGEAKIIQTIQNDKQPNETVDYFDTDWNLLKMRQNFPNSTQPLKKPSMLSEMLSLVKKLSCGKNIIRVDLYLINSSIYFSEYTFFSDSGLAKFEPKEWDYTLGEWIHLSNAQ